MTKEKVLWNCHQVAENTVAIFSKTHCPYCKRIKGFFKDKGIEFEAMELDIMGQLGKDIQVYDYAEYGGTNEGANAIKNYKSWSSNLYFTHN